MTLDRDRCGTSIRVQNRLNLPNPTAVGFKIALFIFHHILGGNSLKGPFLMARPICITKIHQWTPINVIDALMRTHSLNSDVVGYIYTIFGNIFTSGFLGCLRSGYRYATHHEAARVRAYVQIGTSRGLGCRHISSVPRCFPK